MAEIIVTSTADSGAGSLRQAIADAQDGDVILFDTTVFPAGQTTTILLSSYLQINKSVSIYGGVNDGNGGYTSGATKRYYVYRDVDGIKTKVYIDDETPAQEGETVLFENVCRVALDGQSTHRCLFSSFNGIFTVVGVEFKNGAEPTTGTTGGGCAIRGASRGTFVDCAFVSCSAAAGGAMESSANGVVANGCNFTMCIAHAATGGGVYLSGTSQNTLNDCIFDGCSATNGGGVYSNSTSQNTLNDCVISGCSATTSGGGVYSNSTSQNTLNDCTITGCSATTGGGVYSGSSSQNTLNDCVFSSCSATTNGGAIYSAASSKNALDNCTISDCSATTGGGVYSGNSSQNTLNNCAFDGCTATANGGAVFAYGTSQNTLDNCAITNCNATSGGGLRLVDGSTATLNACSFDATSTIVTPNGGIVVVAGGITTVATAELNAATITIADGAALTITTSAIIGAATFTSAGRGYLATAAGIDTSSATLTNVVACSYGAGLESFSARETTRTEIKLDWTQTDTTIPVLVEQKVGDSWVTVVESTAGTYNVTVEPATRHLFRAFDGVSFHVDAAWHGIEAPQFKVVGIIVEADAQDVNWQAITEVVNVDGAVRSGQSITILARIYDAYDNETVLLNETGNIVSVVYTLEKRSKSLFDYTWTPVEGHDEVEVSSECVLEDLQTSDAWTVDEDGYSFVLTPDTTEHTLFATPGVYRFRVKITLAEGNPVVFYEEINVVDE